MTISTIDTRDAFFDELYEIAKADPNVVFLTADMGAFSLERFKKDLPRQYFNVGVAEQNMVSVAAGLALGGKKVFIYSIVPFATLRCYEQIKVDLCCMNLPVTIIGIGAGVMYGGDGPTHHALHDIAVMRALPEMTIYNPADSTITEATAQLAYKCPGPSYVRIEKGALPLIYDETNTDFSAGVAEIKQGKDAVIVASGLMVHVACAVAERLVKQSILVGVVDVYRVKPLNTEILTNISSAYPRIVSLEENSVVGGLGSALSEVLTDQGIATPMKRLALPDQHCFDACSRETIHRIYGLEEEEIARMITGWVHPAS